VAGRFRGSLRGRARSQSRLTAWSAGTGGTTPAAIATTTPTFIGQSIFALVEGVTLIRIRGYFSVRLTLATATLDGWAGAFGIGIASLAAVTAGVASVPTPLTEQGAENWLYWQAFEVKGQQLFSTGGGPGLEQHGTYVNKEIDSKAMRKFPTDMSVYAIVEMVEVGTAGVQIHHDSRVLAKLP